MASFETLQQNALALPIGRQRDELGLATVLSTRSSKRDWTLRRLMAAGDAAGLLGTLLLACAIGNPEHMLSRLVIGAACLPAWILLLKTYGLYDRDHKRISHSSVDDVPALFHALLVGSLLEWVLFRVLPVHQLDAVEVIVFASSALFLVPMVRTAVRLLVRRQGPERALIVGSDDKVRLLDRKLRLHPEYALDLVGVLDAHVNHHGASNGNGNGNGHRRLAGHDLSVVGRLDDLRDLAAALDVDRLMVCSGELEAERLVELLRSCQELGLKVAVLPEMFDVLGPSVEVDEVEGVTVLGVNPPALPRTSRLLKRAMDVAGAAFALLFLAPVLATIAIAIKLDSPGPVFFAQERTGRRGQRFRVLKFRTMVQDAEAQREKLLQLSEDPNWLKIEKDPRITRVGHFLRHTSLDELPQFVNVLKGDMSLVGPRPLIASEDELVTDWGRARLDLTPGITGLWQVLGRTNIPFEEMVKLDYLYVTNWSLWSDVRLLLRTFPAVLMRRGVN